MSKTVTLKNGVDEVEQLVESIMWSLRNLFDNEPMLFYELVTKCRDPNHEFFGDFGNDLVKLDLVESDGSVHSGIRNIVLSAVSGDFPEMTIDSPVAS